MLGAAICMVVVSLFTKQDSKDSEAFFAALKNGMNRSYKIEDKAVAAQAGMRYRRLNHQRIYAGAAAKEPRRLSLCPYEGMDEGRQQVRRSHHQGGRGDPGLNPREISRMSGHIAPARAVRAPGAWFPQTEAAECPVSA